MKNVFANLTGTGSVISVKNANDGMELRGPVVLCGSDEPATVENSGELVYRFNDPVTGWFCRINTGDLERCAGILRNPNADCSKYVRLAIKVTPLETVSAKQLEGFTPAFTKGDE